MSWGIAKEATIQRKCRHPSQWWRNAHAWRPRRGGQSESSLARGRSRGAVPDEGVRAQAAGSRFRGALFSWNLDPPLSRGRSYLPSGPASWNPTLLNPCRDPLTWNLQLPASGELMFCSYFLTSASLFLLTFSAHFFLGHRHFCYIDLKFYFFNSVN